MRDLQPEEIGFVYGAGSKYCPPKKHKAKNKGSGSYGKGSRSGSGHYKGKGSS